jgi:hypothetical protein
MNRHTIIAAIALAVMANVDGVLAETSPGGTTQWLYNQCSSAVHAEQDVCSAYLLGIAGVMERAGFAYENRPQNVPKQWVIPLGAFGICLASSVNGADVRHVFTSWAEKNPNKRDTKMPQGAMAALLDTWPCKPPD